MHEPVCLSCGQLIRDHLDLENLLFSAPLCAGCRSQLKPVNRHFHVEGVDILVLQEYTPFLERLFFQYKEGLDVALAPLFLEKAACFKKYPVYILPSWWEKSLQRGFEPMERILAAHGILCSCPFVKLVPYKQSSLSGAARRSMQGRLALKDLASVQPEGILADDVLTTGSTLLEACRLSGLKKAVVLAAHPDWLKENESGFKICPAPNVFRKLPFQI